MLNHGRLLHGVLLASAASGPLLILAVRAATVTLNGVGSVPMTVPNGLLLLPAMAGLGLVFGLLPNLIGGYGLGLIAAKRPAPRRPAIWAPAGAVLAPITFAPILGSFSTELLLAFSVTGLVCALTCRAFARWG